MCEFKKDWELMVLNYCYAVINLFNRILLLYGSYNIYTFAINCIAWTLFKSCVICDAISDHSDPQ